MVSSETSPWAKSGGLADVLGSLPSALARRGHPVATLIPRYMGARDAPAARVIDGLPIVLGRATYPVSIWQGIGGDSRIYFLDHAVFNRPGIYGDQTGEFSDNHIRFALLSKAALEVSRRLFAADIIHCHDWQAALVPAYLKDPRVVDPALLGIRTLLTIHNLGYQGQFPHHLFGDLGLPPEFDNPNALEFWGNICLLKAGVLMADALSTVSPKYAEEIQTPEFGFGMDGMLRERRGVLSGILNGVDYERWDPEKDPLIPARYAAAQIAAGDLRGKEICKRELVREMGLPESAMERPLLGIVSRFAAQKGFDLITQVAGEMFQDDLSLAALGSGDSSYEEIFRALQQRFPDRIGLRIGYDDALAHRIEAGADIFLMPSHYEPCGLNQIYSLRYGTVPVVRATGGLEDTIISAPSADATGFKFVDYNGNAFLSSVREACAGWKDRKAWTKMMARGMRKDFSWTASAGDYSRLYGSIASSTGASESDLGKRA